MWKLKRRRGRKDGNKEASITRHVCLMLNVVNFLMLTPTFEPTSFRLRGVNKVCPMWLGLTYMWTLLGKMRCAYEGTLLWAAMFSTMQWVAFACAVKVVDKQWVQPPPLQLGCHNLQDCNYNNLGNNMEWIGWWWGINTSRHKLRVIKWHL